VHLHCPRGPATRLVDGLTVLGYHQLRCRWHDQRRRRSASLLEKVSPSDTGTPSPNQLKPKRTSPVLWAVLVVTTFMPIPCLSVYLNEHARSWMARDLGHHHCHGSWIRKEQADCPTAKSALLCVGVKVINFCDFAQACTTTVGVETAIYCLQ
jgi:hypothetical protein